MSPSYKHHVPWFLWPFVALWRLIAIIVGIPMAIIGVLLFLKGIF